MAAQPPHREQLVAKRHLRLQPKRLPVVDEPFHDPSLNLLGTGHRPSVSSISRSGAGGQHRSHGGQCLVIIVQNNSDMEGKGMAALQGQAKRGA